MELQSLCTEIKGTHIKFTIIYVAMIVEHEKNASRKHIINLKK